MSVDAGSQAEQSGSDGTSARPWDRRDEQVAFDRPGQRTRRAAQRITALGEMTGGIAHDFRNVLAVIESSLSLAERDREYPEKLRFCLAAAHQGVARGLKLISRLLEFAKQQDRKPRPEDVNELLRNLELFVHYGAGPDIRVLIDLDPELPACLVDPSQFNAALLNLVVNARDAMPEGGLIRIATRLIVTTTRGRAAAAPRSWVRVRIRDDGQGMPASVMRRIFDPYFTTKGETGTGLGLPQVQAFMKLAGGRVSVASRTGIGTTVDLLFPALQDRPKADRLAAQIDRWINEGGAEGDGPRPGEGQ